MPVRGSHSLIVGWMDDDRRIPEVDFFPSHFSDPRNHTNVQPFDFQPCNCIPVLVWGWNGVENQKAKSAFFAVWVGVLDVW